MIFDEARFLSVVKCYSANCELMFADCEFAKGLLLGGKYNSEVSLFGKKTKFTGVLTAAGAEFNQSFRLSDFTMKPRPTDWETPTAEVSFRDASFRKKASITDMH
ncbi:MAG: hypothetical protein J0653_06655, partial [Deltaproteobacteria bacterium]|nr:hypothetical protein [Deltaproteobacteria bacterium]